MENEEKDEEKNEEDNELEGAGSWLRDNLRIIISIIIVVAIAGGVYSYSKRNQTPDENSDRIATSEQSANDQEKVEINEGSEDATSVQTKEQQKPASKNETVASTATSQETEESFIETAGRGDSQTRLARRALANYLEKNPDSGLTAEHKIYIEDYLRKNSGFKGGVYIGTSMEFSKDLVTKAIESSKTLDNKQLQNLHKYAVRVPSLS
ncbi:MAG: hypothetical protein WC906_03365 [Parcubacteria group bacterium]|jgi:hypothetical protein